MTFLYRTVHESGIPVGFVFKQASRTFFYRLNARLLLPGQMNGFERFEKSTRRATALCALCFDRQLAIYGTCCALAAHWLYGTRTDTLKNTKCSQRALGKDDPGRTATPDVHETICGPLRYRGDLCGAWVLHLRDLTFA